jgi:hypothetical protein
MTVPRPSQFDPPLATTFSAIFLEEVSLKANADFDPDKGEGGFGVGFGFCVMRTKENPLRRQVHLRLGVLMLEDSDLTPYSGDIQVFTQVTVDRDVGAAEIDLAVAWAAVSALVGSVRTHLDALTAIGPHPRLNLSPVNAERVLREASVVGVDGKAIYRLVDGPKARPSEAKRNRSGQRA